MKAVITMPEFFMDTDVEEPGLQLVLKQQS